MSKGDMLPYYTEVTFRHFLFLCYCFYNMVLVMLYALR